MDLSVFIVIPILSLLMFDLGLELRPLNFVTVGRRPRTLFAGLVGQILLLPALAYAIATVAGLEQKFFVGLMLLACCPGGSSSNVFSGIAGGNVALSVSLTACSSIITLFTLPLLLGSIVELPVGSLVIQNLVLVLFPVLAGMIVRAYARNAAQRIHRVLSRLAFPALVLLATVFFVVHRHEIIANIGVLGLSTALLVVLSMAGAYALSRLVRARLRDRKTLVIEVGMQNAAQAIALAVSPMVFSDPVIAIPAIVYALMMNVILLIYVAVVRKFR